MEFAAKDKIFISDKKERAIKVLRKKKGKGVLKQLNKKRYRKDSTESNKKDNNNSEISFFIIVLYLRKK